MWAISQENGGWEPRPECVTYAELMKIYLESHTEYMEEGEGDWDDAMKYAESLGGFATATNPAKSRTPRTRGKKSAPIVGQQMMPGVDEPVQNTVTPAPNPSAPAQDAYDSTPDVDISSVMGAITNEARKNAEKMRQQASQSLPDSNNLTGANSDTKPVKPKTQRPMTAAGSTQK